MSNYKIDYKREWSTHWCDVCGREYKIGDIVRARVLVGILWKDRIGQVVMTHDGLALSGDGFLQSMHYVNKGEIIGNIFENPELLEGDGQ